MIFCWPTSLPSTLPSDSRVIWCSVCPHEYICVYREEHVSPHWSLLLDKEKDWGGGLHWGSVSKQMPSGYNVKSIAPQLRPLIKWILCMFGSCLFFFLIVWVFPSTMLSCFLYVLWSLRKPSLLRRSCWGYWCLRSKDEGGTCRSIKNNFDLDREGYV